MSLIIDAPGSSSGTSSLELLSAESWRTDRTNTLVYGGPGVGKTDFAARHPYPVILDTGENGQLTCKKMLVEGRLSYDIPIIRTKSFSHAFSILQSPVERLAPIFSGSKFSDYPLATVVVDNVSVLEEWCIAEVVAAKGKTEMEGPEINTVKRRMTNLFRAAWNINLNTVLIAHEYDGREGTKMYKAKDKGPMLLGGLSKTGPASTDFFLYFTKEYAFGTGDTFVAYTDVNPTGYPARTRVKGLIEPKLINPSYEHLRTVLDRLDTVGSAAVTTNN